jgi:ABC-2 type transport system ATP-binding protein
MLLEVSGITKKFGPQKALDNVTLSVPRGQVVGLLGPNGAGKSTLMRSILGYLPTDAGTVTLDGQDVRNGNDALKGRMGYLPEHNPLYQEMYVREFLDFIAGLHNVKGRAARAAKVEATIERVGLTPEAHKPIAALSKGYRQRVGLAQAILHDPELLILDEPTSGLDPLQLKDIRTLIKSFGQERTVILSTHIMQEVEAMCDRVIMIKQGRIVTDAPLKDILAQGGLEETFNTLAG